MWVVVWFFIAVVGGDLSFYMYFWSIKRTYKPYIVIARLIRLD